VNGILSDNNIYGQVHVLVSILESDEWAELWTSLNIELVSFSDLGVTEDIVDSVLWQICQQRGLALITANRNSTGADSLEATIRAHNTVSSLPVFTIGDGERVLNDKPYAHRAAAKLLEYLLEIDKVRGTGRLFVP